MTRKFIFVMSLLILGFTAFACEMAFEIDGEGFDSTKILPGSTVKLVAGETYTISVEFVEDHRNCKVPPDETLFILNDEKWRTLKETQALILQNSVQWSEDTKTANSCDLVFVAQESGTQKLMIVRECSKGGYDETITFIVE